MRKNIFYLFLAIFLATVVIWPVHQLGSWYPMHDSTHLARVSLMLETISRGQFPPIWADDLSGGLGYPLFQFYAPLFHLISSFFASITPSVQDALKISIFLMVVAGSFGTMLFASGWGMIAATVSGIVFALAPYGALNLYVRGAFSEYLSLALLPWVFMLLRDLTKPKKILLSGLSIALFVLSHNLIPILALPMILVWGVYHNTHRLKELCFAILISVALSAWFIIPLVFERSFTNVDQVARTTSYGLHFVEPWQIWNSTWGFGGSGAGVEDGMSFKLGKLNLILGLLAIVFAYRRKNKAVIILSSFAIFSLFLATSYSSFLWDNLTPLQMVQFPWRSLGVASFFLTILAGYSITRLKERRSRLAVAILIIIATFVLNHKYFAPSTLITKDQAVELDSLRSIKDISQVVPEFVPRWLSQDNQSVAGSTIIERAYYPTWKVILDGREVHTFPSQDGKLAFLNPTSSSNYSYFQSHTQLENIASLISLVAIIIWTIIYVKI